MRKTVISTIVISVIVIIGTVLAILYAQGYRIRTQEGITLLQETGLLSLTSKPEGARVLINGNLTTATNDTINLEEDTYEIRIERDGYFPWSKTVDIKKGVVSGFQIRLFPSTPELDPITRSGAENPTVDPSGRYISYTVTSGPISNRGIYTLDMNTRPILTLGSATTQLVSDIEGPFSTASLEYSPDGSQLIATTSGEVNQTFLLKPTQSSQSPQNVTVTLNQIEQEWIEEAEEVRADIIQVLPEKIRTFADETFSDPTLSPGNEKIKYKASGSATLPVVIDPPIPGRNPTEEARNVEEGNIYVYDIKEDKNYLLYDINENGEEAEEDSENEDTTPTFVWHPTASYLLYSENGRINVIEYDGTNKTTLYAGPFQDDFLFPWPDGSNLVILTNLNLPDATPNLYRLSLE